jgi:hypothetical protein
VISIRGTLPNESLNIGSCDSFGPDRFWKRVLDTSGTEALSPGAARIIREGHLAYMIPPDQHGRTVLFAAVDQAEVKFLAESHSEDRKDAFFYNLQLIASQNRSPKNEFIIIQVQFGSDYKFFPEMHQVFARGSRICFPVTCKGAHMICAPKHSESIQRRFVNTLLHFIWKVMKAAAPHAERRTLDFVTWTNEREQHEKLKDLLVHKFGLQTNHLPDVVGGDWNYESFLKSDMAPPARLATEGESSLSINLLHFDFLLSKSAFEELESDVIAPLSLDLSRTSASVDILDFDSTNNTSEICDFEPSKKKSRN